MFDGTPVLTWAGEPLAAQRGQVLWGSGSSGGTGRMNYHSATFAINGLGTVANYSAGFDDLPAFAPVPTTQGWTLASPVVVGAVTNAPVSPDSVTLPLGFSNVLGLENDQRGSGYPRFVGSRVDIGAFETQTALRFITTQQTPTGVLLRVQGEANEPLSIQWNTRPGPGGWQRLINGTTDGTGVLPYTDPGVAGQATRFYRAVRP